MNITVTRIPVEGIRPSSSRETSRSRTARTSRPIKTQSENTAKVEKFKNPLLGIEVNLRKKIHEVEAKYHQTSYHKRNVLLDALDDIAHIGMGFKRQLTSVVEQWRPPQHQDREVFETAALKDLMRAQRECREASNAKLQHQTRCEELREQIEDIQFATKKLQTKTAKMKGKLNDQSDHFAMARRLDKSLTELQAQFDSLFDPPKPSPIPDELRNLMMENDRLKKDVDRQRYELEICNQITRHMQFAEQKKQ